MIIQTPIRNSKRDRLSPYVIKEIKQSVKLCAKQYNCSQSFVIAVILADAFKIEKQELYK